MPSELLAAVIGVVLLIAIMPLIIPFLKLYGAYCEWVWKKIGLF